MRVRSWKCGAVAANALLLLVPAILLAPPAAVLRDPAILAFLAGVSAFVLADASTVKRSHGQFPASQFPASLSRTQACDAADGCLAVLTGVLILIVFWTAIVEHMALAPRASGTRQMPGILLMLGGVALRREAVRTLGAFFVTPIVVRAGQPLVQRGVYRLVRHPSEAGILAIAAGACLLLESRMGLVLVGGGLLPLVVWRVRREDRVLEEAFGRTFERYAERVQRLVPFVW